MPKSIPRAQYGLFFDLVAKSPDGFTVAELARRVNPEPDRRALAECLNAMAAERKLESTRDKDGHTLRYRVVASAVPPAAAPAAKSETNAVPPAGASASPTGESPPPAPVPSEMITPVPAPEPPSSAASLSPRTSPVEESTGEARNEPGADQRDEPGADSRAAGLGAASEPAPAPVCDPGNPAPPVGAPSESPPAQAAAATDAPPDLEANDCGRPTAEPSVECTAAPAGDIQNAPPAVAIGTTPPTDMVPDPLPAPCLTSDVPSAVPSHFEPSPIGTRPHHRHARRGRDARAAKRAAAESNRESKRRTWHVLSSVIAGAAVLAAIVAWRIRGARTPPAHTVVAAEPLSTGPLPPPPVQPATPPSASSPSVSYPAPAPESVPAPGSARVPPVAGAGAPAGPAPGATDDGSKGAAHGAPGAAPGTYAGGSTPTHAESDSGASGVATRSHPPFPTAAGTYVLREGRWEILPQNNAHVIDPTAERGREWLARVQRWRAAGIIPGTIDLAGAVLFDGYEPVPIVDGADVLFAVVAAKPASGPHDIAPGVAAEAPVELLPSQTLPDGSRYLPRPNARGASGKPATALPLAVASASGGITLLACVPPLRPGSYVLRAAGGLVEVLVR